MNPVHEFDSKKTEDSNLVKINEKKLGDNDSKKIED